MIFVSLNLQELQTLQRLKHLLYNGQIKKINHQIIITYSSAIQSFTGTCSNCWREKWENRFSIYNDPSDSAILNVFWFFFSRKFKRIFLED